VTVLSSKPSAVRLVNPPNGLMSEMLFFPKPRDVSLVNPVRELMSVMSLPPTLRKSG